jgi:lysophosphatidate acyltransferase
MGWLTYAMATPPVLVLVLRILSLILPPPMARLASFSAFFITGMLTMLACAAYGVVASIILRCVGYGGLSQWTVARAFKWSMWVLTGVTFRIMDSGKIVGGKRGGFEALRERPAVIVGNHQT